MLKRYYQKNLQTHKRNSLYRKRLIANDKMICFASNDYLGLSKHYELKSAANKALLSHGLGTTSSALVCGYNHFTKMLEERLQQYLGYSRVLFFNNGYLANLSAITALANKNCEIFMDKHNHASLYDGVKMSQAKLTRYFHCDLDNLVKKISTSNNDHKLMISESTFSMDSDETDIAKFAEIAKKYHALSYIDDSHGFGLTSSHKYQSRDIDVYMATFSKALGGYGGFVASSNDIIEHIIQFARPYMYSTSLPPMVISANLAALELIKCQDIQDKLTANIQYFTKQAKELKLNLLKSNHPIQPLIIGDAKTAQIIHEKLLQANIVTGLIRSPTVANNKSRLRIIISASHQLIEIDRLLEELYLLSYQHPELLTKDKCHAAS